MKNPIERKRTEYVCGNIVMNSGTTAITGFTVQDDEDYKISDAWIVSTANTEYPLENKTIKKYGFKEDGQWRGYFTGADKGNNIYKKFRSDSTIATGTPVYILNAETWDGEYEGSKWDKMMKDPKSCLSVLAADGIVLFSHKTLVDAFLGFAYEWVRHTEEFGKKGGYRWERKAVYDLSKGLFIPCSTPTNLI